MKQLGFILFLATLIGCQSAAKKPVAPAVTPPPQTLEEAVSSSVYRTPENKLRDQYRHPLDTLKFFGVQPNMTVVEIWPSAGWYTEILAPYLATNGHYFAAVMHGNSPESTTRDQKFMDWQKAHPDVKVTATDFNPPEKTEVAPPGTADMVLTFRNVHNWMMKDNEQNAFNAFFKALKSGGILGVVEHRGNSHKKQSAQSKGYVREDAIIKFAKKAGFKLVEHSEINANPKDTKNYEKGVWTLPPSYALGDVDHAKYMAVGESDRMTLKFVKP